MTNRAHPLPICIAFCLLGCSEDSAGGPVYMQGTAATGGSGVDTGATGNTGGGLTSAGGGTDGSSGAGASSGDGAPQSNAGAGGGGTTDGGGGSGRTAGTDGGEPAAGTGGAGAGAGGEVPAGPCDLGGRWLVTEHRVTDAIGTQQTAHTYLYYEIAAQGDGFAVTRGLRCGDDAVAGGILPLEVSFASSRLAAMEKTDHAGRQITSTQTASGCRVSFERVYVVSGATAPFYEDPSQSLPTINDMASGTTPGWEDWDEDGNPGITAQITGSVVGKVFSAGRTWQEYTGTVAEAAVASVFKLDVRFDNEPNVIGFDPPDAFLLGAPSVPAANPALHFVELARLGADQALGDDLAVCDAVVELAPTLTPTAAAL